LARSVPARAERPAFASTTPAVLLIVTVAVATRLVAWWNPVAHVDDQFYLLAGEELLRGHWPYIDVWDRKPLGLFLLYAGIASIGGGSILGLNLVATAFAAATAIVIRQTALCFASATSATLAALAYLIAMPAFGGQTGQSPVFYNLLMAAAAWMMFRASASESVHAIRRYALAAMLFCGLAMTIKQTCVVEGAYFGIGFLWLLRRRAGSWPSLVMTGAAMVAAALLPTALSIGGYALAGDAALRQFIYANYLSIFERGSFQSLAKLAGAAYFLLYLLPLLGLGAWGATSRWRNDHGDPRTRLLVGWLVAALLGYLAVPAFFDHYALPLLVPLSIAAAVAFDRGARGLLFCGLAAFYLIDGKITDWPTNRRDALRYNQIATAAHRTVGNDGCIYVVDGPSRLYSEFPSCRPTRYLFPDHLVLVTEAHAVGVDTEKELGRILDTRPDVLITRPAPEGRRLKTIDRLLGERLAADYRPVLSLPPAVEPSIDRVTVWQRNDLVLLNR
jgi:hypothetical protein